jgi:hypothetical protein
VRTQGRPVRAEARDPQIAQAAHATDRRGLVSTDAGGANRSAAPMTVVGGTSSCDRRGSRRSRLEAGFARIARDVAARRQPRRPSGPPSRASRAMHGLRPFRGDALSSRNAGLFRPLALLKSPGLALRTALPSPTLAVGVLPRGVNSTNGDTHELRALDARLNGRARYRGWWLMLVESGVPRSRPQRRERIGVSPAQAVPAVALD